jgi:hypothetical protein
VGSRPVVFLLTPFSADAAGEDATVYCEVQAALRGAAEDAAVDLVRADDIFEGGKVVEQIHQAVDKADLVLAVLTGRNPNVYYELGVAVEMGHSPILVAASADDLSFDMSHWRCQMYGEDLATLRLRLAAAINESKLRLRDDAPPSASVGLIAERVAAVSDDKRELLPIPLVGPFKLVVHIVPATASAVDPSAVEKDRPVLVAGFGYRDPMARELVTSGRFNEDGFFVWERYPDVWTTSSYVQVFRDGCLEAVDCNTGSYSGMADNLEMLSALGLKDRVQGSVAHYISYLRGLGVESPLVVGLTCLGLVHPHDPGNYRELVISDMRAGRFTRKSVQAPAQIVHDSSKIEEATKRMLDTVFQAAGLADSTV